MGAACDATLKTAADCDLDANLYCDKTTSTCQTYTFAATGSACGTGIRCQAGATCIAKICVAPAADGAACDDTAGPPCLTPARCVANVCTISADAMCVTGS
jgi:hypothetical protein